MSYTSKKLKVNADLGRNRLHFTIANKIIKKDLDKFYTDLRFCVADLQSNFDVIGDFSECDLLYLNSIPTMKKIMCYLISKRIREKVRVVKDNLFCRQIKNYTSRQQTYDPIYVSSIKEAETILSREPRRNGVRISLHQHEAGCILNNQTTTNRIINISTSGCALDYQDLKPEIDEPIQLTMTLRNHPVSSVEFVLPSKVVRTTDNFFAVQFDAIKDDQKDQLWACLIYESHMVVDQSGC